MDIRIGFGVDRHQLVPNRKLIIGGVEIPVEKGALGHSDADALLHAICDALLGALALKDIGFHFPDTDPKYKGIDSLLLLKYTYQMIQSEGYQLVNLDSTVMLEKPKIGNYVDQMRMNIAQVLDVEINRISIKATRGEKVGPVGEGLAIQVYAQVLIEKITQ